MGCQHLLAFRLARQGYFTLFYLFCIGNETFPSIMLGRIAVLAFLIYGGCGKMATGPGTGHRDPGPRASVQAREACRTYVTTMLVTIQEGGNTTSLEETAFPQSPGNAGSVSDEEAPFPSTAGNQGSSIQPEDTYALSFSENATIITIPTSSATLSNETHSRDASQGSERLTTSPGETVSGILSSPRFISAGPSTLGTASSAAISTNSPSPSSSNESSDTKLSTSGIASSAAVSTNSPSLSSSNDSSNIKPSTSDPKAISVSTSLSISGSSSRVTLLITSSTSELATSLVSSTATDRDDGTEATSTGSSSFEPTSSLSPGSPRTLPDTSDNIISKSLAFTTEPMTTGSRRSVTGSMTLSTDSDISPSFSSLSGSLNASDPMLTSSVASDSALTSGVDLDSTLTSGVPSDPTFTAPDSTLTSAVASGIDSTGNENSQTEGPIVTNAPNPSDTSFTSTDSLSSLPAMSTVILSVEITTQEINETRKRGAELWARDETSGFVGDETFQHPESCSNATLFRRTNGQLLSRSRPLSVDPGVDFINMSNYPGGSITTTFVVVGGVLYWDNNAFYNGTAGFCEGTMGEVYATFTETGGPPNCIPVKLVVYTANQCQNGEIVGVEGGTTTDVPPSPSNTETLASETSPSLSDTEPTTSVITEPVSTLSSSDLVETPLSSSTQVDESQASSPPGSQTPSELPTASSTESTLDNGESLSTAPESAGSTNPPSSTATPDSPLMSSANQGSPDQSTGGTDTAIITASLTPGDTETERFSTGLTTIDAPATSTEGSAEETTNGATLIQTTSSVIMSSTGLTTSEPVVSSEDMSTMISDSSDKPVISSSEPAASTQFLTFEDSSLESFMSSSEGMMTTTGVDPVISATGTTVSNFDTTSSPTVQQGSNDSSDAATMTVSDTPTVSMELSDTFSSTGFPTTPVLPETSTTPLSISQEEPTSLTSVASSLSPPITSLDPLSSSTSVLSEPSNSLLTSTGESTENSESISSLETDQNSPSAGTSMTNDPLLTTIETSSESDTVYSSGASNIPSATKTLTEADTTQELPIPSTQTSFLSPTFSDNQTQESTAITDSSTGSLTSSNSGQSLSTHTVGTGTLLITDVTNSSTNAEAPSGSTAEDISTNVPGLTTSMDSGSTIPNSDVKTSASLETSAASISTSTFDLSSVDTALSTNTFETSTTIELSTTSSEAFESSSQGKSSSEDSTIFPSPTTATTIVTSNSVSSPISIVETSGLASSTSPYTSASAAQSSGQSFPSTTETVTPGSLVDTTTSDSEFSSRTINQDSTIFTSSDFQTSPSSPNTAEATPSSVVGTTTSDSESTSRNTKQDSTAFTSSAFQSSSSSPGTAEDTTTSPPEPVSSTSSSTELPVSTSSSSSIRTLESSESSSSSDNAVLSGSASSSSIGTSGQSASRTTEGPGVSSSSPEAVSSSTETSLSTGSSVSSTNNPDSQSSSSGTSRVSSSVVISSSLASSQTTTSNANSESSQSGLFTTSIASSTSFPPVVSTSSSNSLGATTSLSTAEPTFDSATSTSSALGLKPEPDGFHVNVVEYEFTPIEQHIRTNCPTIPYKLDFKPDPDGFHVDVVEYELQCKHRLKPDGVYVKYDFTPVEPVWINCPTPYYKLRLKPEPNSFHVDFIEFYFTPTEQHVRIICSTLHCKLRLKPDSFHVKYDFTPIEQHVWTNRPILNCKLHFKPKPDGFHRFVEFYFTPTKQHNTKNQLVHYRVVSSSVITSAVSTSTVSPVYTTVSTLYSGNSTTTTTVPPSGTAAGTVIIQRPSYVTTTQPYSGSVTITSTQTASGANQGTVYVQAPLATLNCDPNGYLIQTTTLYRVNITTGNTTTVKSGVGDGRGIQAIGYNVADNFIYGSIGVTLNAPVDLIRIAADGSHTIVNSLNISNTWYPNSGDVDESSQYWASFQGSYWLQLDLKPGSPTFNRTVNSGQMTPPHLILDWAYVPGAGNYLWALGYDSPAINSTFLQRFDRASKSWTVVANLGNIGGSNRNAFGAVYASDDGYLYGSENFSGGIYRFNIPPNGTVTAGFNATYTKIANGPTSLSNDGARCIKAANIS
ncbi:hypothetical protein JX266_007453 [Neoarthrinium moseri]|nr:hypothetical protein JX266_007453 [Neoarthrinium moseri]